MKAQLKLFVKIFDWPFWFPCSWTMRDHHRPLSWCKHMVIWPLTWLVELWKVTRKTPLLAYINQEFVAIKRNCLDGTPVVFDCLSLAEGLGWRTASSPLLGTSWLCWGKFHCLSLSAERPPHWKVIFVSCFICYYFLPFWGLSFHVAYSFLCCAKAKSVPLV